VEEETREEKSRGREERKMERGAPLSSLFGKKKRGRGITESSIGKK